MWAGLHPAPRQRNTGVLPQLPRERLIKALSFRSEDEFAIMADYPVRAFLVDAHDPVRFGGTGRTCDWNVAHKAAARHPLVLAGGLGTKNILAALEAVRPLAWISRAVSSRHPGKKIMKRSGRLFLL